ncbi:Carbonic AnHydrase [Chamberlinius hualienensis]
MEQNRHISGGYGLGFCMCYLNSDVFPGFRTTGFSEQWTYHGPRGPLYWPSLNIKNNQCGGRKQSPINVETTSVGYTGRQLQFLLHDRVYLNSTLYNNGHTVNLTIYGGYTPRPSLHIKETNGYIKNYIFDSIHFHFGDVSDHGSEHQIDHRKFSMEMHSIYYKEKYGSFEDALNYQDGLAVVTVLFYLSPNVNAKLSPVVDNLPGVLYPDTFTRVPRVVLSDLFPSNVHSYFHYKGSLTTPPCTEAVSWYILSTLSPIAESQLQRFRQLTKSNDENDFDFYVADNVRPIQSLNGRKVYMHF